MKKILTTFFFLIISLVGLTFYVGVSGVEPVASLAVSKAHLYGNPDVPIENISLLVLYFVPKDRIGLAVKDWKEFIEPRLKELQEFHNLQMAGKSKISYELYPEIIAGEKKGKEYEINILNHSSPEAIIPVTEEISRRVLKTEGDLYLHSLHRESEASGARQVYLIVFEGEGGAGNGNFSLISRDYLAEDGYKLFGTTFLAHEFYHTLGLPDNYQQSFYVYGDSQKIPISILTAEDIMGRVRVPIKNSYIDREILKKMGI
ncbi:MAG: hypothetical protein HW401_814 [Parcubacteria group bacterium]|nr:hypothetical protein [Parcubacteria group bacterium]